MVQVRLTLEDVQRERKEKADVSWAELIEAGLRYHERLMDRRKDKEGANVE